MARVLASSVVCHGNRLGRTRPPVPTQHALEKGARIILARGVPMLEELNEEEGPDLERLCQGVSPNDEPCGYPATVHCPTCKRWFCDAHAEEETWHSCVREPGRGRRRGLTVHVPSTLLSVTIALRIMSPLSVRDCGFLNNKVVTVCTCCPVFPLAISNSLLTSLNDNFRSKLLQLTILSPVC